MLRLTRSVVGMVTLLLSVAAKLTVEEGKLAIVSSVDGMTSMSNALTTDSAVAAPLTRLAPGDVIKVSFSVSLDGEPFQPHQAMIQWLPVNESLRTKGRDYLAVVKTSRTGKGKWDVGISRASPALLSLASSGDLVATLLIGHFKQTPLSLPLGTFSLAPALVLPFPYPADEALPKAWEVAKYKLLPELHWTFKAAEKKVNMIISSAGTLAVVAPWVILVGAVGHIKPSLASPTLNALSFLLCLYSFEALVMAYWTSLKLLPTLPYFISLFALTAWTGKKALEDVRQRRLLREATEAGKKSL